MEAEKIHRKNSTYSEKYLTIHTFIFGETELFITRAPFGRCCCSFSSPILNKAETVGLMSPVLFEVSMEYLFFSVTDFYQPSVYQKG